MTDILKYMKAQKLMMELKGKPGHEEQVKIVREMEMRLLDRSQQTASYQNAG